MTTAQESLDVLSRALDQTSAVLAAVEPAQLTEPTPCRDWDVAHLVGHLVNDPRNLLAMARGDEVDWSAQPEPPRSGWTEEFRRGADDLLAHWRGLGDEAPPAQIDWQTAEFAVHTWDLAQATGWPTPLDPAVAEVALAFMSNALTPDNRGGAFGAEQPAPDGAGPYERLAAFAGRPVT
jgi:uncharacterized protein (TIGR03086 family)